MKRRFGGAVQPQHQQLVDPAAIIANSLELKQGAMIEESPAIPP